MPLHIERRQQGLLLRIQEAWIAENTTYDLAPEKATNCECRIVLDLRQVTFIEPFGLVYLYWLIHNLLDRGAERITILPAEREDVRTYLVRMHFPRAFDGFDRVRFQPDLAVRTVRERDLRDRLVELTPFAVQNDDEVRELTGRVMETVLTGGVELTIETRYLRLGLVELISNIQVHSETRTGVLAVQRYSGGRVRIAIGDGGIGIPGALRSVVGSYPDHEIVLRALEPSISSRPDRGGLGLSMIADDVRDTGGYMAIRSGRAHVRIAGTVTAVQRRDCSPISGTQVEILWM